MVRTPTSARGKVLILTFIFTQCRSACPRMAVEIRDTMRATGSGVEAHAISVDPKNDTPEQAKAWLKRIGFRRAADVLVGSKDRLAPVWERFGIVPVTPAPARRVAWRVSTSRATSRRRPTTPTRRRPRSTHYPSTDDGFYRGRLRHGGYLDYEHSAYVLLIDERGRQRVDSRRAGHLRAAAHDVRLLQAES